MARSFFVRSLNDGKIYTISGATTQLGAFRLFAKNHPEQPTGYYEVKERGVGDWKSFRLR